MLIMMGLSKFTFSKKKIPSPPLWSNNSMGGKKTKCENDIKWGPRRYKMMRWFKIWSQNSNQTASDSIFGQKSLENRQNVRFSLFSAFFCRKGVKCYSTLILRQNLESSHHFASLRTRDTSDNGFYYPTRYQISQIVKNYPARLFGRIVVMQNLACLVSTYL